jgi:hypothetical protein
VVVPTGASVVGAGAGALALVSAGTALSVTSGASSGVAGAGVGFGAAFGAALGRGERGARFTGGADDDADAGEVAESPDGAAVSGATVSPEDTSSAGAAGALRVDGRRVAERGLGAGVPPASVDVASGASATSLEGTTVSTPRRASLSSVAACAAFAVDDARGARGVRAGARFAGAFFSLGCAAPPSEDGDGSGVVTDGDDSDALGTGVVVFGVVVLGVAVLGVVLGVVVFGVVVLGVVVFGVVVFGVVDLAAGVFRVVVFAAPPCPAVVFVSAAPRAAVDLGDELFAAVALGDSAAIVASTTPCAGCSSGLVPSTSERGWASGSSGSESTRQPYQAAHGSQRFHHESTTTHSCLWPVDEGRG